MKGRRFKGATAIHTKKVCSHWSLGYWEVAEDSITIGGFFSRKIAKKEAITEIRMTRRPTPELTLVCAENEAAVIYKLSLFRRKSAERVADCLAEHGYAIDVISDWMPKRQSERDEKQYGLAPDTP